jgi:sulfur carrier protein
MPIWYDPNLKYMHIVLNGEDKSLEGPVTVAQLLAQLGLTERRVAVEINEEIVPRSRHAEHRLHERDRVEVVLAIGGG